MTRILKEEVHCGCGNVEQYPFYDSVNARLNPELKARIADRSLNMYQCQKCGNTTKGLLRRFLYNDQDNKRWIWCYPESARKDKVEIEANLRAELAMVEKEVSKMSGRAPEPTELKVVFELDELAREIGL